MIELLANYSLSEIVAFLITFSLAVKGLVTFYDWGVERIKKVTNKENEKIKEKDKLEKRLEQGSRKMQELREKQIEFDNQLNDISSKIDLLIESDRDSIKAFITREHHYFCKKGWIDDYSLDCLEKRFKHYVDEHGNSYAEELMGDIRQLPCFPSSLDQEEEEK